MEWIPTLPRISHLSLLLALCPTAFAQWHDRLNAPLDNYKQVTLRDTRNPRLESLSDNGPLAPTERVQGLGFRFKPTAEQRAALDQLLEDQQNPASPTYHAWLTPEEFGDRFGISQNDYARVSAWLESQGFQIDSTARSRTWVTFSGTVDHVRRTFGADLHRFQVNGRPHFANVVEAQIPADLEPLVYTLRGLDDLPGEPRGRVTPMLSFSDGSHALGPGDLATIYNINPLLQKGYNGAGQKIVVAGKSALKMTDLRAFRELFDLPQNDPKVILTPGFADPGMNEEFLEVTSDVELVGSVARNASIIFVYAPNVYAAAEYAIDQNLAPVISFSFGGCEKNAASQMALIESTRAIAKQANAQGITWVASSGDTGVAACESQRTDYTGVNGIGVLHPSSFPEVTGVGGTTFVEGTGSYWSSGNSARVPTALSYIPETVWNETPKGKLATSGGGASMFFAKPSWQTGPGVPNVNARLVPDVSFAADWDHDPYIVLANDDTWDWGGTSAATPVFAGVLTILNQYLVNTGVQPKPGLGNINPRLYQMAQTTSGVFHDITTGDNIVPCKIGTPDCTNGRYGYTATPGWDPVTGLGSLDANNFVLKWSGDSSPPSVTSTTVTVTANPSVIAAAASTVLSAVVKPGSGTVLPTGPVYFSVGQTSLGYADLATSGGTASGSITVKGSQLTAGANTITAFYGGASTLLSSTGTVAVTVSGSSVSAAMSLSSSPSIVRQTSKSNPSCSADRPLYHQLNLQELKGAEVRLTKFVAGPSDLSDQIQSWFGSLRLPPFGTLSAGICWLAGTLPATKDFEVEGVDGGGQAVKATLQVSFKPAALIPGTLAVSKNQVQLVAASGSANTSLNVTLPGDEAWSVTTFPANQKSSWLTVTPKAGRGPAQVNLTASVGGLSNGVYTAKLIFQSEYMTPQFIEVPVTFLVGVSGATTITGAQNAASFKPVFAPGMLMSLYGTKLANSTQQAKALPLPLSLDSVTVGINGVPAPLWFVSPGQVNLQIPYETALGNALVVVNNNGQVSSYTIQIAPTAPGIFNNAAAITPVSSADRGSTVSVYLTGDGELTPMLDTGAPPPASTPPAQLPKPRSSVKVTVAGIPADVTFIGNPWLVGITQLNFNLPANTPTGVQPVVVTIGGVASAAQTLTVR